MSKEPRSLHGKVAVVTGGGRGIGKAIALALTSEGARVAIGDVDVPAAEAAAAEIGGATLGLPLDVTDGAHDEEDDATALRLIAINLHGVILGTKEAMRRFKPRGTGHIVNVASSAGKTGFPHLATYCATKHAVVGLSEAVRAELRGTGVDISCVMPNIVNTELSAGLVETPAFKNSTVGDVADAVIHALQHNRFDVYVPRSVGVTWATMNLVPRRARDLVGRALKINRALTEADHTARAAYEARAAASAPAAETEGRDTAGV